MRWSRELAEQKRRRRKEEEEEEKASERKSEKIPQVLLCAPKHPCEGGNRRPNQDDKGIINDTQYAQTPLLAARPKTPQLP